MTPPQEPSGIRAWTIRRTTLLLDRSPWLRVFEEEAHLPTGGVIPDFLRIEAREYAVVFAVTEHGQVPWVRQYKHGPAKIVLQLPAGYLEEGEAPEACARRELLEETGYAATDFEHLGSYNVDGNRGFGRAHVFLARGACRVGEVVPDALEPLEVVLRPIEEIESMMRDGSVGELSMVAALGLALLSLRRRLL